MIDQQPTVAAPAMLAVIEPDEASWDSFTEQHPHGHLLQSSRWGRLKAAFGWQARRMGIMGKDGLLAGAQLLIRRRWGFSVAYVPRGPLWATDPQINTLLLQSLDYLARRARSIFLRIEPNQLEHTTQANALHSMLLLRDFRPATPFQPRTSIHLDVTKPSEQLLASMSKGHRADTRRAAREGVVVRIGDQQADIASFYQLMEQTAARAEFAIHSYDYYRTAWELFAPTPATACHSRLLLAERGEKVLAASLVFAWAHSAIYFANGSSEEGLKSGANHALQWQALQWAQQCGCTSYDFWGIPDAFGKAMAASDPIERQQLEETAKADPLYGVYRFKKGFGGTIVRYLPAYDRIYLPPLYTLWQRRFSA